MHTRTVFFVSDGTGITAETFGNSILAQFPIKPRHIRRPFIDTAEKAYAVVREINDMGQREGKRPIVFLTLVDREVLKIVRDHCQGRVMDMFGTFIEPLEEEFETKSNHRVGRFSDVAKKVVSIINLASVAALEGAVGQPVDPLRFRANLYVRGWPAWHEFDLLDREIHVGGKVRLKVVKRIVRCAATNVDPVTAARDLNIPKTLMQTFNHMDCGIYAEVIEGGDIAAGNTVTA